MSDPAASQLPLVHLILGEELLLVQQHEQQIIEQALSGQARNGFNFASFRAGEGADQALNMCRTVPMLARRRVVLIRDLEQAAAPLLDSLLGYCANPSPTAVLIMTGQKLPPASGGTNRGRRLQNQVKKIGTVQRFRSRDLKPVAFAREYARKQGCVLSGRSASLLVELVGSSLSQLQSEIDKAICYIGGEGPIQPEVIEQVCSLVADVLIWDLTDAIIARNPDKGLAVAHRMLETAGSSDLGTHRMVALITWQVRQLLQLQSAMRNGEPIPSQWRNNQRKLAAAQATLRQQPLGPARILEALTRANRQLNRARAGERRIFESLVMNLTSR